MPQSERSNNIRELLKFIDQSPKGQTLQACVSYVVQEITQFGATEKTAKAYLAALGRSAFIKYSHPYWKITPAGKKWKERHEI